jgi:hypothetical protein
VVLGGLSVYGTSNLSIDKMSNSRFFETVGGFKGWLLAEGCICQTKGKKSYIKKNLLGCQLSADKQLAEHLKTHISHIIYSKFGQLNIIFKLLTH